MVKRARMPPESPASQSDYIDLARKLLLQSIERAAASQRHGTVEIKITFHDGEIREVQEVDVARHKI